MDSNSGSVQSSSGDEEYDSRPESLPAFLNTSGHFGASIFPHHQQQQHSNLFDPSSANLNILQAFSQSPQNPMNPNSCFMNLDLVRSRGLRSDPSCTDLGANLPAASSSSASVPSASQAILGGQGSISRQGPAVPSMQLGSAHHDHNGGGRSSSPADQTHVVARNPKKRTRASRRAPTTVLTTDTSNFRAMVQEFTGIPAPPFSGSPFSRRLDLFGTVGSGIRSAGHLEPMGSLYPLRPSAQKVHQHSPFVSSSSSSSFFNNSLVDATNNIAANHPSSNNNNTSTTSSISLTTSTFNPSSINYQLPSDLGIPKHPQNLMNMHNQMLPFHSLLQPTPLHPSLNVSSLGAKSQASNLGLPSLDELGMGQGHVNTDLGGLPSQGTTEGMRLSANDGGQDPLRSFDGNYGNMQRVNSCKLNYSASASSDFNHSKGLENVSSRGTEGTVDSWIPSEFRIGD